MRLGRASACLLTVVTLATAGCAGEGAGDNTSRADDAVTQQDAGDQRSEAERQEDEAIAETALLTLDDFPAGWEAVPAEDDEDDDELQADLAQCLGVDEAELDTDNPTATSPTFTSSNDEKVAVDVSLTRSLGDASRRFEILQGDAAPGCYAEAIKSQIARNLVVSDDAPENVNVGELTFNRISFESLGDGSMAFRTTIPVAVEALDIELYIDFVLVRVGRAGIQTTFQSQVSPFDTDEAARLTQIVVDRVSAADVG
jgi:hypothetical protein